MSIYVYLTLEAPAVVLAAYKNYFLDSLSKNL